MSTRALRHRTPSRSGAVPRTEARPDAPVPALSKAATARLARLEAMDVPWLGQGQDAMLAGYDGPEVSGPPKYSADRVKGRCRPKG